MGRRSTAVLGCCTATLPSASTLAPAQPQGPGVSPPCSYAGRKNRGSAAGCCWVPGHDLLLVADPSTSGRKDSHTAHGPHVPRRTLRASLPPRVPCLGPELGRGLRPAVLTALHAALRMSVHSITIFGLQ